MELKARLSALEQQINSLQSALVTNENSNGNYGNNGNLKSILLKLKMEHQTVLQNIEKALEIVELGNQKTPVKRQNGINLDVSPSPRLKDKINSVLGAISANSNAYVHSSPLRNNHNVYSSPLSNNTHHIHNNNNYKKINSSPLSPATEKSHITFDILNELDRDTRKVHFSSVESEGEQMSVASREYLKKYGLL